MSAFIELGQPGIELFTLKKGLLNKLLYEWRIRHPLLPEEHVSLHRIPGCSIKSKATWPLEGPGLHND